VAAPIIAAVYALAGTPSADSYPASYPYVNNSGGLYDITSGSAGPCGTPCTGGPRLGRPDRGNFTATVTVKDTSGQTATTTFTWSVQSRF
jgi:hypothetical protein